MRTTKITDLKSRYFAVEVTLNKRLKSGYKIENISEVQSIPVHPEDNILYFIELSPLRSQKSHFNDILFYDYELQFWACKNKEYLLEKNQWDLSFTRMPIGLGASTLALEITDDQRNKISFNMWADSRDALGLCKTIVAEVHRFHKMADGFNLRHYFRFGRKLKAKSNKI